MPKNNFADDSETESKVAEALVEETSEEVAPSKIKVGEKEYDPSELESLVGLGELGREMEEKWNTKIDKVYPEYTRSQNEKKALEEKLAQIESKAQTSVESGSTEGDALKEAQEAARKLGIVLKDDFKDQLKDSFRDFYLQERAAERLIDTGKSYEKEIDGKDGRPAFKTEEILTYMAEEGIKDPMKAYKFKYEKELDAWKESQLGKAKRPGLATDDSMGSLNKAPKDVKPTVDNLNELVAEALRG